MVADGLNAGARCCFNYIKVNGAYLVNAGAQWNTDEVWSSNVSGNENPNQPVTNLFDENPNNPTWADANGYTITFPQPIDVTSSIELRGNSSANNWSVVVDNVETAINAFGGAQPAWSFSQEVGDDSYSAKATISTSGSFTAIKTSNNSGGLTRVYVDGKLLIDATYGTPVRFGVIML